MIEDIEELKALIVHNLDVLEFLDILGIDMAELVEHFEEEIEEHQNALRKAVS
jgi:hypothetical protein